MYSDAIVAVWQVSIDHGSAVLTWEDLNVSGIAEWSELPEDEKKQRIQGCLDNLPNEESKILTKFWVCT